MGMYGSPEIIPEPKPDYEYHLCKHCQIQVSGNYCPICGRALSKKAKFRVVRLVVIALVVWIFLFFELLGYAVTRGYVVPK